VGGYTEPNWFNGGAVPVVFPYVAGNLGIRYKPIKQLQTRLGLGIALTGFWFGISADYGIDSKAGDTHPAAEPPSKPAAEPPSSDKSSREVGPRDTL
jgi:hypothetical protein